jgi:PGF-CTERM protein
MTKKKGIWAILAVVLLLLLVLAAVAVADEMPTTPWGCENPSPSIAISASRSQIPPDGISTSEIKVVVSWPGGSNITGGTLGGFQVNMSTTLGRLTEAGNESNSGSSIRLITDNNGIVTALLSGDETGVAHITSTTFWACNKTTVTFVAPGATPIATSPIPTVPSLPDVATPTATAGATPSPTAISTESPTTSPVRTLEPTSSPGPTPTGDTPGFEAVFAIAGLLVVAYLVLRRERKV